MLLMHVNVALGQLQKVLKLSDEVMAWTVSTMEPWPEDRYSSLAEAMIDNEFFIPLVFRGGMFPEIKYNYSRDSLRLTEDPIPPAIAYTNKRLKHMFAYYLFKKELDDLAYKKVMLSDPRNFRFKFDPQPVKTIKAESIDKRNDSVRIDVKQTNARPQAVESNIKFIPARRYWTSALNTDLKFNYSKWAKNWGGAENMDVYSYNVFDYNYAKKKFSLKNQIKMLHQVNKSTTDTVHKYNFTADKLDIYSNFGIKAIGHWNYSTSATFTSRIFNTYRANSHDKTAGFLAPFTAQVSVGMSYDGSVKFKVPNRAFTIHSDINPLTFDYTCSNDKDIAIGTYPDGSMKHVNRTFGSSVYVRSGIRFNKSITLDTNVTYFTNYELIRINGDTKLAIVLSRYFSTSLHVFFAFDDSRKLQEDEKILQTREVFQFGFAYRWW
jgi:hypothetical protein